MGVVAETSMPDGDDSGQDLGSAPQRLRATNRSVSLLPGRSNEAVALFKDAATRVEPTVLANERRLNVLPALAQLFPQGLQRGSTVGVRGPGCSSLGLAMAAGPVESGSWVAMVGCEHLSLVSAEQLGIALTRTVLVAQPPKRAWGAVVAALVDTFEVVVLAGRSKIPTRDVTKLLPRLRDRGSVIIDIANVWSDAHDVVLDTTAQRWSGLGQGHGVLASREIVVAMTGRRGVAPREVSLLLPDPNGAVQPAEPHAGSDIDRLVAAPSTDETDHVASYTQHLHAV